MTIAKVLLFNFKCGNRLYKLSFFLYHFQFLISDISSKFVHNVVFKDKCDVAVYVSGCMSCYCVMIRTNSLSSSSVKSVETLFFTYYLMTQRINYFYNSLLFRVNHNISFCRIM